jgi:hypothetical protein
MAKQIGLVKLKGTMEDFTFYTSEDGFMARRKGGVSAERIKNDPKFRLTRLNGQEFGIGGVAGNLFRAAWKTEIAKAADSRVSSRITKTMVAILQTDTVSDYGYRKVENGNPSPLLGFDFNAKVSLDSVFEPGQTISINRTTGQAVITLPAYTPEKDIAAPDGTTHYNIFAAVAAINFASDLVVTNRQSTGNLAYDNTETAADTLTLSFTPNSPYPVFLVMGIEFMKIVNGKVYEQSKGQNALQIVAVDVPPAGEI